MRYAIESYKLIGVEHFRIIDTFNGGKVVAKGFQTDAQAITRRDELNQFQSVREVEFNTRQFERAHGRRPSGRGSWAFCDERHANSDNYLDHAFWFYGLYSEAKSAARKHFAALNVSVVVVLS